MISIHSKGLKKGDTLPTIAELSLTYKVSQKTVKNAYEVLKMAGIVVRRQRTGTMLIAQLDDNEIRKWSAKNFEERKVELFYILDTIRIFWEDYLRYATDKLPADIIEKMKRELSNQHKDDVNSHAPYFVSDIILTPIIMHLPAGVLQKYYFFVHKPAAEFANVCGLELWFRLNKNAEVYSLVLKAISALEAGNGGVFVDYGTKALQLNIDSIMQTFGECYLIEQKK